MTNKKDLIAAARLLEDNGFVLMPKEPNWKMQDEMMWKAALDIYNDEDAEDYAPDTDECAVIYKAAISARPTMEEIING